MCVCVCVCERARVCMCATPKAPVCVSLCRAAVRATIFAMRSPGGQRQESRVVAVWDTPRSVVGMASMGPSVQIDMIGLAAEVPSHCES